MHHDQGNRSGGHYCQRRVLVAAVPGQGLDQDRDQEVGGPNGKSNRFVATQVLDPAVQVVPSVESNLRPEQFVEAIRPVVFVLF